MYNATGKVEKQDVWALLTELQAIRKLLEEYIEHQKKKR